MARNPKYDITMRTYWDSFTDPYQMGDQKHRLYLMDLLKEKGVKSVLDVGCGTGPIYEINMNHRYDFDYKGTDYSPAMIEIAKEHFPDALWEVEDARKLTESDNSWDCVLLLHCLDHLDDYASAIKEAARVSNKYVCIVLWRGFVNEGTNLNDRNTMGKEEGEEPWEDTHLQEYSEETLEKAFKDAGLKIEEIALGEKINSDHSKYNFLYLLRKENT